MKFKRTILFFLAIVITMTSVNLGTVAWFTDQVSSDNNKIQSGDLDAALLWNDKEISDKDELFNDILLWEPGVVAYENLTIQNKGDLAFQYQLYPNVLGYNQIAQTGKCLLDVLKFAVVDGHLDENSVRAKVTEAASWTGIGSGTGAYTSELMKSGETRDVSMIVWWEPTAYDNDLNLNNGKTLNTADKDGNNILYIDMGVKLDAAQATYESDAFGDDYDAGAVLPELPLNIRQSVAVTVVEGKVAAPVTISAGDVQAVIPQACS